MLAVLFLLLCAATMLANNTRFWFATPQLVHNTSFAAGLRNWQVEGNGHVTVEPGEPPVARLHHATQVGNAILTQEFTSGRSPSFVRIRADARVMGVVEGKEAWHIGRVVLLPFGADGQFIAGRPNVLLSASATTDWNRYEAVFPIGADVETVKIQLQVFETSGTLEVRNLVVQQAFEVKGHDYLIYLLGALWLVFVGATLIWLSRRLPRHGLWVCLALGLATAILVAPRPGDSDIRPILLEGFIDAGKLSPYLTPLAHLAPRVSFEEIIEPDKSDKTIFQRISRSPFLKHAHRLWLSVDRELRRFDHLDIYIHGLFLFALTVVCLTIGGPLTIVPVSAALLFLALVSEFIQVVSAGRNFSYADQGYNLLGIAGGIGFYALIRAAARLVRRARQ